MQIKEEYKDVVKIRNRIFKTLAQFVPQQSFFKKDDGSMTIINAFKDELSALKTWDAIIVRAMIEVRKEEGNLLRTLIEPLFADDVFFTPSYTELFTMQASPKHIKVVHGKDGSKTETPLTEVELKLVLIEKYLMKIETQKNTKTSDKSEEKETSKKTKTETETETQSSFIKNN